MSLKGTLRSVQAAQRRAERESKRRQRELERQQKQLAKMQEFERARYEVEVFENYLDVIMSIHKDCGHTWNWHQIKSSSVSPGEPKREKFRDRESNAQQMLEHFQPKLSDKLLRRVDSKREELTTAVEEARKKDEDEYLEAVHAYKEELAAWKATQSIAERMISGNIGAYLDAIKEVGPFSEIAEIGSSVSFEIEDFSLILATVQVNSEKVIPKEIKTVLKSGKLSVKNMPKTRFYELYQDYVCGCVLRIARELFALLPIEMVIITAQGYLLNTKTGHMENQSILSVAIPKATLKTLNFGTLDPSDSMQNFVHNMKYMKTKGFQAVEQIFPSQLQSKSG